MQARYLSSQDSIKLIHTNIRCMVLRCDVPNHYKSLCLGSKAIEMNCVILILLAIVKKHQKLPHQEGLCHSFLPSFFMASTRSTSSPSCESIHFSNLEFTVVNDGEPGPSTGTPTGNNAPRLTPDR
jgi:hypothetical protein